MIHTQTIRNAQRCRYDCQNLMSKQKTIDPWSIAYVLSQSLHFWVQYCDIFDSVITVPDCIWYIPGFNIRLIFSQYRGQETYVLTFIKLFDEHRGQKIYISISHIARCNDDSDNRARYLFYLSFSFEINAISKLQNKEFYTNQKR